MPTPAVKAQDNQLVGSGDVVGEWFERFQCISYQKVKGDVHWIQEADTDTGCQGWLPWSAVPPKLWEAYYKNTSTTEITTVIFIVEDIDFGSAKGNKAEDPFLFKSILHPHQIEHLKRWYSMEQLDFHYPFHLFSKETYLDRCEYWLT